MGSLILVLHFLTIVPVPGREAGGPSALGRAAWWFPVVGLLLGSTLAIAARAADALFPPLVAAALLVTGWKVATGGIHLDGLADCLDGLAGRDPVHRGDYGFLQISNTADQRIEVFVQAVADVFADFARLTLARVEILPGTKSATRTGKQRCTNIAVFFYRAHDFS